MFSVEKQSQSGEKKGIGIKSFYSSTPYRLEYEKTASVNYLIT